ncbi:Bacterial cell division protein FtsW, lipid II flippase [Candidatus Hepatincolaceae symbiont of Richtersius coronifer]
MLLGRTQNNIFSKWFWQNDKTLMICTFLLLCSGLILVITASPFVAMRIGIDWFYFIKNHLVYCVLSLGIIFFLSLLNKDQIIKLSFMGMIISLLLMIGIIAFGVEINGSKRWLYLLGFSFQPSEMMKVFFPVCFSFIWQYFNEHKRNKLSIYLILLILYIVIISLLFLQPDIGMLVLVTLVFTLLLFLTGISFVWILLLTLVTIFLLVTSYFVFPHVNYRLNNFLFEEKSYQVSRANDSIASGKIFGKGAGQGVIKEYLPDSHTDFIFAVAAEEFGLVFNLFLVYLYFMLIYRCYKIANKQEDPFKVLIISGLSGILGFQAIIHIASNVNLIPTKGMTLPFISYGGSSLISAAILIGLIFALTKKEISLLKVKNKK